VVTLNKNYYFTKRDEYELINSVVKKEIERIWGNELSSSNATLDNDQVYKDYFERYQHLIDVDILKLQLSEVSIELAVNQDKIAAFIHRSRNGEFPFSIRKTESKFWLQCFSSDVNKSESLVWLDAASIESFGVYKSDLNRFMVKASTITGKEYRASIYSIPEMLIEDALHDLISQCSDL